MTDTYQLLDGWLGGLVVDVVDKMDDDRQADGRMDK